nr:mucoidy inhibitor MuiA family protein [Bacteroidota bacterium]
EPIPFANVAVFRGGNLITGSTTDFDGRYSIRNLAAGYYQVRASFVGYQTKQFNDVLISPNKITFLDLELQTSAALLEAVEISEYKVPLVSKDRRSGITVTAEELQKMPNRSASSLATNVHGVYSGNSGGVQQFEIETTNYLSNTLKRTATNLEYAIDIPYTIHSDGQDFGIKIKEVKLPVRYVYQSVPKLDNDAFLTAEIVDPNQLNLLSGNMSVYYQGTFTGESILDMDHTGDTLSVSLGRDKNILIKREVKKEVLDKRFLGSSIKETIGWDITVKNNKSTTVNIIIEDQYPLAEKKSIEVELLETSDARVNEKTGKLTWSLQLNPNEKVVLSYKYSVKYPKYMNLNVE